MFLSFLLTLSFLPVLCQAQTETSLPDKQIMESPNIQPLPDTLKSDSAKFSIPSPVPQSSIYRPFGMYGLSPLDYGYASWELHQGFNASIGLHVTFSPSKYALPEPASDKMPPLCMRSLSPNVSVWPEEFMPAT